MKKTLMAMLLALAGCGESAAPAADASVDAAPDIASADALAADAADAPAACDVGAPPVAQAALPMVRSMTYIAGDGGMAAPTPSGGDPSGRWLMTAATLYLGAGAQGQVYPDRTATSGTGWVVVEGGQYRLSVDFSIALATVMVGTVRQPFGTESRGAIAVDAAGAVALTPACATEAGAAGAGSMRSYGFSRDAADRGRLFLNVRGMLGALVVVIDLERVP